MIYTHFPMKKVLFNNTFFKIFFIEKILQLNSAYAESAGKIVYTMVIILLQK